MKTRILTALILAPVALAGTWFADTRLFAVFVTFVFILALWEWARWGMRGWVALCAGAAFLFGVWGMSGAPGYLGIFGALGLAFWLVALGDLYLTDYTPFAVEEIIRTGAIFVLAWAGLVWLHFVHGAGQTIALLLMVWAADSCAYFVGRRFGRRKLAPRISPGKTVEGVYGGIGGAVLVAVVSAFFLDIGWLLGFFWVLAAAVAAGYGVIGDLYESRMKRRAGVKDSGGLLPGHGGILDRIDGLLAAAPAFAGVWWLATRQW